MALRTLSLCSGVGGIDLGLKLATNARTVCYVEWSRFPAAVIAARIKDGCLDDAPIWDDVGTFDGRPWRGRVDCIVAGFPCQPVSLAGKRLGMADERFIWDDIARIIGEVGPRYVFLENVPGILTADGGVFLDRVLGSLVALGFDCEWDLFSAEETGAPHKRQRWFCLAHSRSAGTGHRSGSVAGPEREYSNRDKPAPLRQGHRTGSTEGSRSIGRAVADPRHGLVPVAGRGPQRRDGAGPAGAVLGDAKCQRRENPLRLSDFGSPKSESARGYRVYPPARNDHAGWAAVEASLEPAVCRDADGLAPGLDPSLFAYRNQRLRAVGNGVCPLTAATAWIELRRRFGG